MGEEHRVLARAMRAGFTGCIPGCSFSWKANGSERFTTVLVDRPGFSWSLDCGTLSISLDNRHLFLFRAVRDLKEGVLRARLLVNEREGGPKLWIRRSVIPVNLLCEKVIHTFIWGTPVLLTAAPASRLGLLDREFAVC